MPFATASGMAAVFVALGALLKAGDRLVAARSLFGKAMMIGRERGRALTLPGESGGTAWITVHPSYLLRLPDEAAKAAEYAKFVEDLKAAHALVG